jgi:cytochrome c oxidase subunit II
MLPFPQRFGPFLRPLPALLAGVLLAACGTEQPQTMLAAQGDSAREILSLYNIFLIAAVIVFVIVEGWLLWSVFRYRRRSNDEGIPLQIHGNQPIEIAWTIVPALIVLVLATFTFRTQSILVAAPKTEPLRVTVVGHQWWWEFQYPQLGIVTANELHLPAGQPVEFSLQSADVIHSFWFPRLSGKTDAIPGHTNRLLFTADQVDEPTLIRGECAEFCGGTHAQMGMWAVVEPRESFDAWVAREREDAVVPAGAPAPPQTTAVAESTEIAITEEATAIPQPDVTQPTPNPANLTPVAQGYGLFKAKGCTGCHAIGGYPGAGGNIGPDLTHVGSRRHIVAGWLENTPDNMRRWLRDPNEVKPDNIMGTAIKRGTLTDEEIDALTAYLESLK